jgi:hypothetical protein
MKAQPLAPEVFTTVKKRSDKAWGGRSGWTTLYQDAYDFAVPMRRPDAVKMAQPSRLFDMTAPMSVMHFAGGLQRDLFPPGQESFTIEAGAIAQQYLTVTAGPGAVDVVNRELENTAKIIRPFFMTGEWDTCIHEACIDLAIGTAVILPVATNDPRQPLRFATIPFDEVAIWTDFIGSLDGLSWKCRPTREQVYQMWPKAAWPQELIDKAKNNPDDEITLIQLWWKDRTALGGWHFIAYIDNMATEIVHEWTRTQPVAVPRYYRVPGEPYGRGVVLTAMPSIKTLNKAQELALKSAAIQMLGIWAYRAGGTFNPNTVRFGPGEFWPMQSTGGMLGPDATRLDPAGGNINVAQLIIGNLQDQVRNAMYDTRLPDYQGTPRSASEITGRLQQAAQVHIGAFGRLVAEIMPVIVPRAAEILYDARFLQTLTNIDNLLLTVQVRSPMQAALNADRLAALANYFQIVELIGGQGNEELYVNRDAMMDDFAKGLQIPPDIIPDANQKKAAAQAIQERQAQQLKMIMAQEAAKAAPKAIAGAAVQQAGQQAPQQQAA